MPSRLLPLGIAALSATLVPPALIAQGPALGPGAPFTIAVSTSTIEGAPAYLAAAEPGAPFKVINGNIRNLADGSAHAATNAETQMLLASTTNTKVRMLFTVAEGHYRLIGRKSAGITSLADLRGKRITTLQQTSAHYFLFRMLTSAGLQESDVTLVNVDRTDMARAVVRGDADAIAMWEPEAEKAREALGRDASVFQNIGLYREWFNLYTTTDVLNDPPRRRELVSFVRALLAATDVVRTNPARVIPLVASTIKESEAAVQSAWAHHAFPAALPSEMLDVLTAEEPWSAALQKRAPRTREQLAAFIDPSVLAEALQPAARAR